jgi:two-component system, sensor histidine kinase and response regulator
MVKILIVEDDPITRKMLGYLVQDWGYVPLFSPDGQHALDTLHVDDEIRVVVADVMMPKMDGKELLKTLRSKESFRTLPVILVSSVIGPKSIADLLAMGASRFQPKPVDASVLAENIKHALDDAKRFGETSLQAG